MLFSYGAISPPCQSTRGCPTSIKIRAFADLSQIKIISVVGLRYRDFSARIVPKLSILPLNQKKGCDFVLKPHPPISQHCQPGLLHAQDAPDAVSDTKRGVIAPQVVACDSVRATRALEHEVVVCQWQDALLGT